MKENFYIFLDIDGVMFDWDFIKSLGRKNLGIITVFNPKSVDALNYLIEKLSERYSPKLVISSSWRTFWDETIEVLNKNGVNLGNTPVFRTKITSTPHKRGEEIIDFLNTNGYTDNFVIIDDEAFDYAQHFSQHKIIKTGLFTQSLRKAMVDKFLKTIGYNIQDESIK